MDPRAIVRTDFPGARRGWDPRAVEAHLRAVAAEVEALRGAGHRRPDALAQTAAEQVREIVAAAERGAEEIRAGARRDAEEEVGRVAELADGLSARLRALLAEAERLGEELRGLRSAAGSLGAAPAAEEAPAPDVAPAAPPPAAEPPASAAAPAAPPSAGAPAAGPPPAAPTPPPSGGPPGPAPTVASPPPDAAESARLVALSMALEGRPREEIGRYLAEHYELADAGPVLDAVYAAAGR